MNNCGGFLRSFQIRPSCTGKKASESVVDKRDRKMRTIRDLRIARQHNVPPETSVVDGPLVVWRIALNQILEMKEFKIVMAV